MKLETNGRGFENAEFLDSYGNKCSIQKSSAAGDDYIWLGISNPKLVIFKDDQMGQHIDTELPKNWMTHSRMHLTREMVEELLPVLHNFVHTGELSISLYKTEQETPGPGGLV